jgi:hypothetical protein
MLPEENDILSIDEEYDGGSGAAADPKKSDDGKKPEFKIYSGNEEEKKQERQDPPSGDGPEPNKSAKDEKHEKFYQDKKEKIARAKAEMFWKSRCFIVTSSVQFLFTAIPRRNPEEIKQKFTVDKAGLDLLIDGQAQLYLLQEEIPDPRAEYRSLVFAVFFPMVLSLIWLIVFESPWWLARKARRAKNRNKADQNHESGGEGPNSTGSETKAEYKSTGAAPGSQPWEYTEYTVISETGKKNDPGASEAETKKKGPGRPDGMRKNQMTGEFEQWDWDKDKQDWVPPKK